MRTRNAQAATCALWLLVGLASPAATLAQGDGPRSHWMAPSNTHAVGTWLMFATGNASGFNLPVNVGNAAVIDTRVFVLNYTGFFRALGRSNLISVTLPAGSLSATNLGADIINIDAANKGIADLVAMWDINLFGAPGMTLQESLKYRQRTLLNLSVMMTAPSGKYEGDRLLNTGTNRWTFRFGLPFVQSIGRSFDKGRRITFELLPAVMLFTKNDDALSIPSQGVRLELTQKPILKIESHFTADLWRGLWAAVGVGFLGFGETSFNGTEQDDSQTSVGLGFTVGYQITDNFAMAATWANNVTRSDQGLNANLIRIKFTYAFNPAVRELEKQQEALKQQRIETGRQRLQEIQNRIERLEREAGITDVAPMSPVPEEPEEAPVPTPQVNPP